jgi:hypothetical protein
MAVSPVLLLFWRVVNGPLPFQQQPVSMIQFQNHEKMRMTTFLSLTGNFR